jgi:hypothetical protein
MKNQTNQRKMGNISAAKVAALRAQLERCKQEIGRLDWLSEGSVSENHPGTWRWTRNVRAKTVTVALSAAQAEAFAQAIANHRRLEALVQEMRALSRAYASKTRSNYNYHNCTFRSFSETNSGCRKNPTPKAWFSTSQSLKIRASIAARRIHSSTSS